MADSVRTSLFYTPMLFVLTSVLLAQAFLTLDEWIGRRGFEVPATIGSTVGSARALLGTVAAATITFAGIAFSVSLLMIQQASSQFSPRVLHGFFRDRFSKRVIGFSLGTFTFSLLVLRGVRDPSEGSAVIPHVSVSVAVLLGVSALLGVIGFINHSAHSMEVGEIIRRIAEQARANIRRQCPHAVGDAPPLLVEGPVPSGEKLVIRAGSDGWVRGVDFGRLRRALEPGGAVRLDLAIGSFVTEGAPIMTAWGVDGAQGERILRGAIRIGRVRSIDQDLSFGFRQIVDIGLRALSPGVNDPTTAREAIVYLGAVLRELVTRELPPRVIADEQQRRIFRHEALVVGDYIDLAFSEIRLAAATQPAVCAELLAAQGMLWSILRERGLNDRAELIRREADLVVQTCRAGGMLERDLNELQAVAVEYELLEAEPRG